MKEILDKIQEEIYQVVPPDSITTNTPETRRNARLKIAEVLKKYKLPFYEIICDATNNSKRMIEQKQFQVDIIIKFNLKQKGGHRIQLKTKKENPFSRR